MRKSRKFATGEKIQPKSIFFPLQIIFANTNNTFVCCKKVKTIEMLKKHCYLNKKLTLKQLVIAVKKLKLEKENKIIYVCHISYKTS